MTARVRLVPLTEEHAAATLSWLSRADVREGLGLRAEPSLERTRELIARAASDADVMARAVVVDDVHMGNVIIDRVDRHASKARLHVYVGDAAARGKRIGRRAVALAVAEAFGVLAVEKIYLTVHAKNPAAIAAYESVGFTREGVLRKEFVLGGERVDEIYMGIFAGELRAIEGDAS